MSNMMRYSAELVSLLAFFFVCLLIITKEYNIFALIENIKTNEKFNSYPQLRLQLLSSPDFHLPDVLRMKNLSRRTFRSFRKSPLLPAVHRKSVSMLMETGLLLQARIGVSCQLMPVQRVTIP